MTGVQQIVIPADEADQRLDRWFKAKFPGLTHGRLEKLLRTGQIRLDGRRAKAADRLTAGQTLRIPPLDPSALAPAPAPRPKTISETEAQALRRSVLYRDADVLVIDKPAGLAVQGGSGLDRNLDAMLDALTFEASTRPRLVHRLDRETSGCLVLARSLAAARALTAAFRDKETRKLYWALVVGHPRPDRGRIDAPLAKGKGRDTERVGFDEAEGKSAVTYYAVLDHAGGKVSWLALLPVTGRTHQLRAHCDLMGTPILGDGKYGGERAFLAGDSLAWRLHLHARALRLPHPDPRRGLIEVKAPLPPHMKKSWDFFGFRASDAGDPFAGLDL